MTASTRLATIDLGSNTVRLLVAEVRPGNAWEVVHQHQRVTRLGEGLAATGRLAEAAIARTGAAVVEYVQRAATLGAAEVRVVATSAVREAANGSEFTEALVRSTGRAVEVVSGAEEARLTVRGIIEGLGGAPPALLAFDIGGGSTEFVLARHGRVAAVASLALGVVALAERYPFPEAVDQARYHRLEAEIAERLRRELPPEILGAGLDDLVGTAGTVTTLAALDLELTTYDAGRVQGHTLSRQRIAALLDRLGALTVGERAELPCLEPGRADLIVPGVAIVRAALDVTGAERLVVSDWGLREGLMAESVERRR